MNRQSQRRMAILAALLSITALHAWTTRTDGAAKDETQRNGNPSVPTEAHRPMPPEKAASAGDLIATPSVDTTESKSPRPEPETSNARITVGQR